MSKSETLASAWQAKRAASNKLAAPYLAKIRAQVRALAARGSK